MTTEAVNLKVGSLEALDQDGLARVTEKAQELVSTDGRVYTSCFVLLHALRLYALGMASLDRDLRGEPDIEAIKEFLAKCMRQKACEAFERARVLEDTAGNLLNYLQHELALERDNEAGAVAAGAGLKQDVPLGFELGPGRSTITRERSLLLVAEEDLLQSYLDRASLACTDTGLIVLRLAATVGVPIPQRSGYFVIGSGKWAGALANRTKFSRFMDQVLHVLQRPIDMLMMDDLEADQAGELDELELAAAAKVLHDWAKPNGVAVMAGVRMPAQSNIPLSLCARLAQHNEVAMITSTGHVILNPHEVS